MLTMVIFSPIMFLYEIGHIYVYVFLSVARSVWMHDALSYVLKVLTNVDELRVVGFTLRHRAAAAS